MTIIVKLGRARDKFQHSTIILRNYVCMYYVGTLESEGQKESEKESIIQ